MRAWARTGGRGAEACAARPAASVARGIGRGRRERAAEALMYEAPGAQALVHEAHVGYRPVGGCVEEGVVVGGCGGLGLGALEAAAPVGRVRVTRSQTTTVERESLGHGETSSPLQPRTAQQSPAMRRLESFMAAPGRGHQARRAGCTPRAHQWSRFHAEVLGGARPIHERGAAGIGPCRWRESAIGTPEPRPTRYPEPCDLSSGGSARSSSSSR